MGDLQKKSLLVQIQTASQRAEQENESNFEYHEKGTYCRMWMCLGNPWVVSKKSDFGATHYIKWKKTEKILNFDHLEYL